jgi:cell division transport system ATP-binding protein
MLKFKGVTKTFGSIKALKDVDLDIAKGEFVFVTGPSGSGKTTLIRLILRELLPDEGEIIIAGEDITRMPKRLIPELRQQIGTVFQDFKVLHERTLEENIELALAVLGIPQKEWEKRIDNVLELTGLKERRKLFPNQLSGGELQRASLARALVINPKLILADEPTGNLDWDTAQELIDLFKQIHKEGKTIVMATHHRGIVENEDFREIVLHEGRVTKGAGNSTDKKQGEASDVKEGGKSKKNKKHASTKDSENTESSERDKKHVSTERFEETEKVEEIEKTEDSQETDKVESKAEKSDNSKKMKIKIKDRLKEKFKKKKL